MEITRDGRYHGLAKDWSYQYQETKRITKCTQCPLPIPPGPSLRVEHRVTSSGKTTWEQCRIHVDCVDGYMAKQGTLTAPRVRRAAGDLTQQQEDTGDTSSTAAEPAAEPAATAPVQEEQETKSQEAVSEGEAETAEANRSLAQSLTGEETGPDPAHYAQTVLWCERCEQVVENPEPLYECGNCGTSFLRSNSADGNSHKCPDCNHFARKAADNACPDCEEGVSDTEVFFCRECNVVSASEEEIAGHVTEDHSVPVEV